MPAGSRFSANVAGAAALGDTAVTAVAVATAAADAVDAAADAAADDEATIG